MCRYVIKQLAVAPDRFFGRSANWIPLSVNTNLNPVRHGGDKGLEEGARGLGIGLVNELSDRELGGAVDRDEEIELALRGVHFGEVDLEEADRTGLELALE
jgi:hypothetical protein